MNSEAKPRLGAWLFVVWVLGSVTVNGLSRISYPQPLDVLVLLLAPLGAFHAAPRGGHPLLFTLYGFLGSGMFVLMLYSKEQRGDPVKVVSVACVAVLATGLACRFAASARLRWDRRRQFPEGSCQHCGYNLAGNTSGICPECGQPPERGQPG